MSPSINVYPLPQLADARDLCQGTVVVIDVLRASTTIIYALQAGAKAVIPCGKIEEARLVASGCARDEVILGGERCGLPISGFDLGNSPDEYSRQRVQNKLVVFTTTNGTRALMHSKQAACVLLGAFVNASALIEKLTEAKEDIHLLCAGTDGEPTDDDLLFAGMIVHTLQHHGGSAHKPNAEAVAGARIWAQMFPGCAIEKRCFPTHEELSEKLCFTLGGKNLVTLGLKNDILAAAVIDRFAIIPRFDPKTGRIFA
ncbi:MAG: 2-phosphosulfolactate phosphatase [Thermoguttaceae bacterium]